MIELLSESDTLDGLTRKMADWISNRALLTWLIDPYEQQVFVFRPGQKPQRVTGRKVAGEGPVEGFELDLARVWKRYQ